MAAWQHPQLQRGAVAGGGIVGKGGPWEGGKTVVKTIVETAVETVVETVVETDVEITWKKVENPGNIKSGISLPKLANYFSHFFPRLFPDVFPGFSPGVIFGVIWVVIWGVILVVIWGVIRGLFSLVQACCLTTWLLGRSWGGLGRFLVLGCSAGAVQGSEAMVERSLQ